MEHLTVKAVAAATELGEFTAIAATYGIDRVKDQIVPGAFERTIARWQASSKSLPVHWNHSGAAADIIGAIDPAAMREVPDEGLYVEGKLDLEGSEVAREAWRSMKNDAVSLSFGYATLQTRKRGDVTDLLELDLFEVSIVPHPANPDTRVLSMKAAVAERPVPTDAELRQQAKAQAAAPALRRDRIGPCVGLAAPAQGDPRTRRVRSDGGAAAPAMGPAQARAADGRPRPRSHRGGTR
jgi:HK97 family phage prohead protease